MEALRIAMHLLDPDSQYPGIAGWRELLTPASLAVVLGVSIEDARLRFRGRVTWTEGKRARLLVHMIEREGDAVPSDVLDIRLLVGVPFLVIGLTETRMTSTTYALQLLNTNKTTLIVRDRLRIVPDYPPDTPCQVARRRCRYTFAALSQIEQHPVGTDA